MSTPQTDVLKIVVAGISRVKNKNALALAQSSQCLKPKKRNLRKSVKRK